MRRTKQYMIEETEQWYQEYLTLGTLERVALKHNVSNEIVRKRLKKYEQLHNLHNISTHTYSHNENFFSSDTPESFYWAGFIAADGCITKQKKSSSVKLYIGLSVKDEQHLNRFKEAIEYTGPIKFVDSLYSNRTKISKQVRVSITITNTETINGLNRFGIGFRKSLTYDLPDCIKRHPFLNHFLRGYFDGDGCVSVCLPCENDRRRKIKLKRLRFFYAERNHF